MKPLGVPGLVVLGTLLTFAAGLAQVTTPAPPLRELLLVNPDAVVDQSAPPAAWIPSPNQGKRESGPPEMVVIHCTASTSSRSALGRFLDPFGGASCHILIPDPEVGEPRLSLRLVADEQKAWHVRREVLFHGSDDLNSRALGIEIVNSGRYGDTYADWQVAEAARWTRFWIRKYPIRYVATHAYLDPSRRADPCSTFPWGRFLELVQHGMRLRTQAEPTQVRFPSGFHVTGECRKGVVWVPLRLTGEQLGQRVSYRDGQIEVGP